MFSGKNHDGIIHRLFDRDSIGNISALFIVLFVIANAYFTYSGAVLIVQDKFLSVLLAFAIQTTIAFTLLALPSVHAFNKLIVIAFYIASLGFSLLFAYTYVYEKHSSESFETERRTKFVSEVSENLGKLLAEQQASLNKERELLTKYQLDMEEERKKGAKSGRGPGEGPEFFDKEQRYQAQQEKLKRQSEEHDLLIKKVDAFKDRLSDEKISYQNIVVEIKNLNSIYSENQNGDIQAKIEDTAYSNPTPLQKAVDSLRKPGNKDSSVYVGIALAAVFDFIALILGVIRTLVAQKDRALSDKLYDWIKRLLILRYRLSTIEKDAISDHKAKNSVKPLDAQKVKYFLTSIISGAVVSHDEKSLEPVRNLLGKMRPLHLENEPKARGIPHDEIDNDSTLAPLMAELIGYDIFINSTNHYILSDESAVEKLLFMIKRISVAPSQPTEDLVEELDNIVLKLEHEEKKLLTYNK